MLRWYHQISKGENYMLSLGMVAIVFTFFEKLGMVLPTIISDDTNSIILVICILNDLRIIHDALR